MNKKAVCINFLLLGFATIFLGVKTTAQWNPAYSIGTNSGIYNFPHDKVPDPLVELIAPYSTGTTLTYQWEQCPLPDFSAGVTVVGTSLTYTFTAVLSQTSYYRRKAIKTATDYRYSNIIKIAVVSIYWEDLNYVREHDVLKAGLTDWIDVDKLPVGEKLQTTTYIDGLGRPLQKVSRETATPATTGATWGDMVQFSEYDIYGRELKKYLPYTVTVTDPKQCGKYKSAALVEQATYYSTVYNETSAYSNITYDNSPLNRTTNIKAPGASWALGNGNSASYDLNDVPDNVQKFTIGYNSGDIPVDDGAYASNTLYKTLSKDENNNQVIEYTNSSGQLILTKTQVVTAPSAAHAGWACVYSIYDDFGLLRYRLQPEAVSYLDANGWSFAGTNGLQVLNELCFRYEYDDKGRNILKKAPGAKELRMLYDARDRVVFMQDGNQTAKSPPEWTANLYDELDRPVITTLYQTSKTLAALQADIDNAVVLTTVNVTNPAAPVVNLVVDNRQLNMPRYAAQNTIEFTDGFATTDADYGFVAEIDASIALNLTQTFAFYKDPISAADLNNAAINTVVKYQFYDDYSYSGAKSFDNAFDNTTAYANSLAGVEVIATSSRTTSFPTGSMVRVLGTNIFLTSTDYYDDKGRHIQTTEDNIKSGTDVTTLQYQWDGRLLSTHSKHTTANSGYANFDIVTKNLFDKIGRVTSVQKNYGSNGFETIATYDLDDMGRLKTKHLDPGYANPTTGKNELEALTYSYNLHNNITGINKDYALKGSGYNKWGNFFGVYLGYDDNTNFAAKQLDGHVTGQLWNTMGDDAQRKYDYTYDNAGRLTSAVFKERQLTTDAWSNSKMDFSVGGAGAGSKITYDLNGNLLSMLQKGVMPGSAAPVTVDNLAYTYTSLSNKLLKVFDNGTLGSSNGSFGDFTDGANGTGNDYVYDDNGNLVKDLNKGLKDLGGTGTNGISYNFLDKPEQIKIPGKGTIKLVYDAEGNKLQKIYTPEGSSTAVTTTYINQFVYKGNDLQYINFEEGRVRVITPVSANNGYDGLSVSGNMVLPNSPLGGGGAGVYDYFIRDYQENVRMILTEETHYGINKCTMETTRAINEEPVFGQLGASNEVTTTRLTTKPASWTSNTSSAVCKLGKLSGHTIGPNSLLKVMAGDVLNASADYYYPAAVTNNTNSFVSDIVNTLVQAIGASTVAAPGVKNGTAGINTSLTGSTPFAGVADPNQAAPGSTPRAYLNVLFFDERFNFVAENSTAVRVSQVGNAAAPLVLPANTKAPKNGYAYIYLNNEGDDAVYFDNLLVSDNRGRIIEEDHYYAFGLKIAGISSVKMGDMNEGLLDNKNLYNDKELIDEADLDWYDYGFRNYDPQIGRFPQLDPLTDDYPHYTPFQYAGNEPIANVDLDGLEPLPMVTVTTYIPKAASQGAIVGSIALRASLTAANTGLRMGLDGVNTKISPPRSFNNTPVPPPTSYLSPAPQRGVYEEARVAQKVKQSNLAAGLKEDGSETFLGKLASNKTFTRAADNLIFPTIEAASYLGGAGEVAQGFKMLRAGVTKEAANVVKKVAVHGNSLKSLKPTWGYKLYSNDGTFLKNGITSKLIPDTRYTRSFMSDKFMKVEPLFPNRLEAYQWEFQQNLIQKGPLNLNMH